MKQSGIRKSPGCWPDGLHSGYRVFVQRLKLSYLPRADGGSGIARHPSASNRAWSA